MLAEPYSYWSVTTVRAVQNYRSLVVSRYAYGAGYGVSLHGILVPGQLL